MSTFYAKSRKVDAVQWFKPGDHPAIKMRYHESFVPLPNNGNITYWVETNQGDVRVYPGDWIVTLPDGGMCPCHPHEFAAKYLEGGDSVIAFADHVREVSSEFSSVHGRRLIVVDEAKLKAFLQATE